MTRVASILAALILSGSLAVASAADSDVGAPTATFELPSGPDDPVVTYQILIGGIAEEDRGPSLTLSRGGRLRVHYPAYMKQAGEYEAWLDPAHVETLVAFLVAKGVADLDPDPIGRWVRAQEYVEGLPHTGSSDPDVTVIELRLDRYQPAGATSETVDFERRLVWRDLRGDVARNPGIADLANLASAERVLSSLLGHRDLQRIGDPR